MISSISPNHGVLGSLGMRPLEPEGSVLSIDNSTCFWDVEREIAREFRKQ